MGIFFLKILSGILLLLMFCFIYFSFIHILGEFGSFKEEYTRFY